MSFHPVFSITIIIVVALPFFLFFVYKEFQRKQKFLVFRIVALTLMVMSMLGLLFRPTYKEEKNSEAIILLTKGYQPSKVDSIVKTSPKLKIIRTKEASPYSNSSILNSWHELINENIFCVIGEGVPSHALELLHHKPFQFIPSSTAAGVTKLIVPNTINVNVQTQIQGTFNAIVKTKLKLIGPDGVKDSIVLDRGKVPFSLTFTPKQPGKFIYSFVTETGSTFTERLPIEVLPEKQLRILFIQKFPTAEVRFLKNFLSEKNHQAVLRYQTSKSNFSYEYANTTRTRINNLHSDLLASFDLLFIDQKSYDELSLVEKTDLEKSINNGLGVLFILNDSKAGVLNEFLPTKSKISSRDTAHLRLSSHSYTLPVLPIELSNDASIIAVTKNKNRTLSGYFFSGEGKIGFQFIQETYRLCIAGNTDDYSSLWTALLTNTARAQRSNFKLKLITPFPYYRNEPINVAAISAGPQPLLYADSVRIPMKENALVDDYWTGRNWAEKIGWHQFYIAQDSTPLNYFVSDTSEWKSLKIYNQRKDNMILHTDLISRKEVIQQVGVPKLVFYFIFLFSSAFLWLAPKI